MLKVRFERMVCLWFVLPDSNSSLICVRNWQFQRRVLNCNNEIQQTKHASKSHTYTAYPFQLHVAETHSIRVRSDGIAIRRLTPVFLPFAQPALPASRVPVACRRSKAAPEPELRCMRAPGSGEAQFQPFYGGHPVKNAAV